MNSATVKSEFFQWISTLDSSQLCTVDRKFLNLLSTNFDKILPLGTSKGGRAKEIGRLIMEKHEALPTDLPELRIQDLDDTDKFSNIRKLIIGPFRGFTTSESFIFDRKYTFMYGPNGSGKSSFCEGLEYALLGSIEESESRRIPIDQYISNTETGVSEKPIAFGLNAADQEVQIPTNPFAYRFAFIEKNRIDDFARIAATTTANQKDRIATLFGLDAFSDFVDGFTDEFDGRYIILNNAKEEEFIVENRKNDISKNRIAQIKTELAKNSQVAEDLVREASCESVVTLGDLKRFLVGEDEVTGIINYYQKKRVEQIPDDLKTDEVDALVGILTDIRNTLDLVDDCLGHLTMLSSQVNYKNLYSAIVSIEEESAVDKTVCPACKTPLDQVTINPFENATTELESLQNLAELQLEIDNLGNTLAKNVRKAISSIKTIRIMGETAGYHIEHAIPNLTEIIYSNVTTVETWKPRLTRELGDFETMNQTLNDIKISILSYNASLQVKRTDKGAVDEELKKYQLLKSRYDEIVANKKALSAEDGKLQKEIEEFDKLNEARLKEIEEENQKIGIYRQYVEAYNRLIGNLKLYRDILPSFFASGISETVKNYYNTINAHDPKFERIETLSIPTAPRENITIRFQGDSHEHNALLLLSEGHIKVLGLSILLAKAVKENIGFLIFDDIVNAIDDDHRDGIAELLLRHPDLKNRQHIVTCHGEFFFKKLEHKLGASLADKEVRRYKFFPAESLTERCVRVSEGNSTHYLLKAKESFDKNELKDTAFRCRQAVESISQKLWKKLGRVIGDGLTVKMRRPNSAPDLSSVIDGLIQELRTIKGDRELHDKLKLLKGKYPWLLLNKGTHEQEDLPEFERQDISDLLALVFSIEEKALEFKLEVMSV